MDRIAEWRPVEPAGPDGTVDSEPEGTSPDQVEGNTQRQAGWPVVAVVLSVLAVLAVGAAALFAAVALSGAPQPAVSIEGGASPSTNPPSSAGANASPAPGDLVVDVEGAVARPGLLQLAKGSRIGDAIAAAGGYSEQLDIAAATTTLNLAALLVDGQQVRVPLRGEAIAASSSTNGPAEHSAAGGLIDVNSATPEQLDTLPGIGPVTAAKIVAARAETPFASIDDLEQRGVVGPSTLEKIRALITVGP